MTGKSDTQRNPFLIASIVLVFVVLVIKLALATAPYDHDFFALVSALTELAEEQGEIHKAVFFFLGSMTMFTLPSAVHLIWSSRMRLVVVQESVPRLLEVKKGWDGLPMFIGFIQLLLSLAAIVAFWTI